MTKYSHFYTLKKLIKLISLSSMLVQINIILEYLMLHIFMAHHISSTTSVSRIPKTSPINIRVLQVSEIGSTNKHFVSHILI